MQQATASLFHSADVAARHGFVVQWWFHRLTAHLLDGLWDASFHRLLPDAPMPLAPHSQSAWPQLRTKFINRLRARSRSEIELWPSQLSAANLVITTDEPMVLSMPTSAGKTRIAELAILKVLAAGRRVVFVTPLRALSWQTEQNLSALFTPMGYSVSAMYGATGSTAQDAAGLRRNDIVVATPEKLDFSLRRDTRALDDVGLIILDEGHMIGPGKREVRYEAQIQRLLNRDDASSRRILCLSAILPSGPELHDFVSWLGSEDASGLVQETWSPTRRRFGTVEMTTTGDARLDLTVGGEKTFVPALFKKRTIGRRNRQFPKDQGEMVLATVWALTDQSHSVLVYVPLKKNVDSLAKKVVELVKMGALAPQSVDTSNKDFMGALSSAESLFGSAHPVTECLRHGVGLHHGSLPSQYRIAIEKLIRNNTLQLIIASPTLAQGVNVAATSIVFHALTGAGDTIAASEFLNVVGRAGRAFADVEGLAIYPIFEPTPSRRNRWNGLQQAASEQRLSSGIAQLMINLNQGLNELLDSGGTEHLLEYVLEQLPLDATQPSVPQLVELLADLDVALLSLVGDVDADTAQQAQEALTNALEDSLWARTLARADDEFAGELQSALTARLGVLWNRKSAEQRRAMYLAGIGLNTHDRLTVQIEELSEMWSNAESAIENDEETAAIDAILSLAEALFAIPPFLTDTPPDWQDTLTAWVRGAPVVSPSMSATETFAAYDFIEDDIGYSLVWAVEALRSLLPAPERSFWEPLSVNWIALALQTGTLNRTAMLLLEAGVESREMATTVAEDLGDVLRNADALQHWLHRPDVTAYTADPTKPTTETHESWVRFVQLRESVASDTWEAALRHLDGSVVQGLPTASPVRLTPGDSTIRSADYEDVGRLNEPFATESTFWRAWLNPAGGIDIEEWGGTP